MQHTSTVELEWVIVLHSFIWMWLFTHAPYSYYSGSLLFQSSHCNLIQNRMPVDFIFDKGDGLTAITSWFGMLYCEYFAGVVNYKSTPFGVRQKRQKNPLRHTCGSSGHVTEKQVRKWRYS